MNGAAGQMPAYYDGQLFTINFKELPSNAESSALVHNKSINTIYMSDQAQALGVTFTGVIDAIQGDGFNPLWQEVRSSSLAPRISCSRTRRSWRQPSRAR
jgi:hypothetical protein